MSLGPFHHCRHLGEILHLRGADSILDRLVDCLEDAAFVLKLQLAFLGVDIHINTALRHLNLQHCQGIAALGY